jgi:hypothetical protein
MPRKTAHELYLSRNSRSREKRLRLKASVMKAHAAERGIAWNLSPEDIIRMWKEQRGRCGYTGKRMYLTIGRGLFYRNYAVSIDRLDPGEPYTRDNVILCRHAANSCKHRRNFYSIDFAETFPDYVARALQIRPSLEHA